MVAYSGWMFIGTDTYIRNIALCRPVHQSIGQVKPVEDTY